MALPLGRYSKVVFGGQPPKRTPKHTIESATYVSDSVNLRSEPDCRISQCFLWSHSKTGASISLAHLPNCGTHQDIHCKILYENIWCRFNCPIELISDQGGHFLNTVIHGLTDHYTVVHRKSTPYYPQANGLAESTNKTLQTILKKIVNENRTDWDTKLHIALWEYQTSFKISI